MSIILTTAEKTNWTQTMPRWTPESKERQREFIRVQKPWIYSTGARTEYGRLVSSQNARKHRRWYQSHDTGVTPENRISALEIVPDCHLDVAIQQESDIWDIQLGDRVKYIGQDPLVQALVGENTLVVTRLTPTIACATEQGDLILEFGREELCNAKVD